MSHFQVISPIDQSIYCERTHANNSDIEKALSAASKARKIWKAIPLVDRIAYCQKALDYFMEKANEIGEELSWQMGRPIRYTPSEITKGFKERAEHMISVAEKSLRTEIIENSDTAQRFIKREPLGTILVLAPWNYPYLTSVNVIIPALLAGNTVLLKHAQQTPLCAERYAEAFESAGLPEGVFQYLHLTHDQVAHVIQDKRIDYIAFTGSVEGGHAIQKSIGTRFIPSGLELGGKDPAYVRADADFNYTVENLVDGSFFNSGQSCCGIERIYIHESLYDRFIEAFVELSYGYVLGNPMLPETTLGPVVKPTAATHINNQIKDALSKGAKTQIDIKRFNQNGMSPCYLAPQILTNVDHNMKIMTEETFGPVVGIMPVKSDAEAIMLMNDSAYGLTASIWSQDNQSAMAIADYIETGTCYLNRCDYLDPALAWTGIKDSGKGATLSHLGYDMLTRPKSFHFKKL